MELINATRMLAGYTMGIEPSGRELLVVVIKGTFRIPAEEASRLSLHDEQVPLVMADVFHGEPGFSAPKYEVDFAPCKQRCDVILNASAHVPGGRPVERVAVGVRIGAWSKSFAVVGKRVWKSGVGGVSATRPQPFARMLISYDRAFGGVDNRHENPAKHAAFMHNPVGLGFHKHLKGEWLDGAPLPNTEELNRPVTDPLGKYLPMAYGAIGRNWEPRYKFAGTYDQRWLDEVFPFLPADFDERYYQAAPADQQLPIPLAEQTVTLVNLTVDGRRSFSLPYFEAPVYVFPKKGGREDLKANLDTLVIEPDEQRVTMTWRVARPLKKNMFEIAQVLVGRKGRDWWQQREEVAFPIPVVAAPAL
ncbi:DUF2169 domain-containing protein [Paraburkholderia sp. MMS20-SJTR3]|uniref:DUF2169 domain-containing protein n=1 Tax=Paraburkholderia sejongensis TaxID=2886946 RepID=A0ABS8JQW6_9BURK|nr:DUF2169 domain-containing protein [Paraburkholderia sp. MMS20-SJTR3]MCC8392300.1 DUF2169 domain-containing protein [Paraburkholderia sp. MMS20-SJTR3]